MTKAEKAAAKAARNAADDEPESAAAVPESTPAPAASKSTPAASKSVPAASKSASKSALATSKESTPQVTKTPKPSAPTTATTSQADQNVAEYPLPYVKKDSTFVATATNVREHRLFNMNLKHFDVKDQSTWPPQYTLLSDEWKYRVANLSGKQRFQYWPASYDSKGNVLAADIGYGEPGIMIQGGKKYFVVTYGNVQLRGDIGRQKGVPRTVPGVQSTSGATIKAGRKVDDEGEESASDSASSPGEGVKDESEEQEFEVETLFGRKTYKKPTKREASEELPVTTKKPRNALQEVTAATLEQQLRESRIATGQWSNFAAELLNELATLQLLTATMATSNLKTGAILQRVSASAKEVKKGAKRMKEEYGIDVMPREGEADEHGLPTVTPSEELVEYSKEKLQGK